MHSLLKAKVIALAEADPREICGYFYRDLAGQPQLHTCRNVATDPANQFEISDEDQITALGLGEPLGIYHSHPTGAASFTPPDLECADEVCLPFYLYHVEHETWHEYLPPGYQVKLVSREFALGFDDCYGLVRHYFRQKHQIYLADYDRDETFSHEEQGIIMASFQKEGFHVVPVQDLQVDDVLLCKSDKAMPQHFAIYRGLNTILHHKRDCLSREEMLTDRWLSRLICVLRHETLPKSV